ncbi:unnamed protein product [Ixodes persulcatus]
MMMCDMGNYRTCGHGCLHLPAKVTRRLQQVSPSIQCQELISRERPFPSCSRTCMAMPYYIIDWSGYRYGFMFSEYVF